MKKGLLFTALGLIIIASGIYFYPWTKKSGKQTSATAAPIYISTTTVKTATLPILAKTIGSLSAWQKVAITPEIAGVIAAIHFKGGDHVQQGKNLVTLDEDIYRAAVQSAQADFNTAKAKFQRYQTLKQSQSVAEQDFENTYANYQSKLATLNQAKVNLAKMQLNAPFTGQMSERLEDVGQYIKIGEPIATLVNKQKLKLHYSLPERYLHQLKLGQSVQLNTNAVRHKTFTGKLIYIAPSINKSTRTIPLTAAFSNQDQQLAPGLFGIVRHILGQKKQALIIPERAIVPTIAGPSVYVIRNQKAYSTAITVGIRQNGWAEVSHGLKNGETIAVTGMIKLKDGVKVNAKISPTPRGSFKS
jgi:membrane fusion protein (multidrug efflux system)